MPSTDIAYPRIPVAIVGAFVHPPLPVMDRPGTAIGDAGPWMEQQDPTEPAPRGFGRRYPAPRTVTLVIFLIVVEAIVALVVAYEILKGKP